MKIVISSGHGKYVRGASGDPIPPQVDEVDEARRIVNRVADYLEQADIEVGVYHDDESHNVSDNLDAIVDFHNSQVRDLDVSIHLNCYDHNAHGTEVEYVTQKQLASKVAKAIADAGDFTLRADEGANYRTDLAFLNNTDEPAILIETFFCDHTGDCEKYHDRFDEICAAIAESLSGEEIDEDDGGIERPPPDRPERPQPPQWSGRPEDIPVEDRPYLKRGDEGPHVLDMQRLIPRFTGQFDGDFGPTTEENVTRYQRTRGLHVDGECGEETWGALYEHKLPQRPELPPGALSPHDQAVIMKMAIESSIATYSWRDRGVGPDGWIMGLSLSFAQSYLKLKAGHPA